MVDFEEAVCFWSSVDWQECHIRRFISVIEQKFNSKFSSYWDLHKWSIDNYDKFWAEVWLFCDVIYSKIYSSVVDTSITIDRNPKWFVGAELNYTENVLKYPDNDKPAIYFAGEATGGKVRQITFGQLKEEVQKYSAGLKALGVGRGDRIAGYMPNCPECVVAMLATASLGAIWSSTSPDFGNMGVLDRLSQVEPKILFSVEAVMYNQKKHDHLQKLQEVVENLPSVKNVIVVPFMADKTEIDISTIPYSMFLDQFLDLAKLDDGSFPPLIYEQVPFDHPLFILFTSGTTGPPKCMVHSVGGTLLKHLEEHILQKCFTKDDKILFYATVGWVIWNWLVTALATGAAIVLYDGSPFLPKPDVLFDLVDDIGYVFHLGYWIRDCQVPFFRITFLGMGAKCYSILEEKQVKPNKTHKLTSLKALLSSGSPLKPESYDYIHRDIKKDLLVGSISGRPVFGERGELVCLKPFPSMPIHFLSDPDNAKYKKAYFEKFPGVWAHGDYCIMNPKTGGVLMLGRSDATLNPGGVRFGSSEIYHVVEAFHEVEDSLCVGQKCRDDERVILFVKMHNDKKFDAELETKIRAAIRQQLSPKHLPAIILPIADIPYTASGKKLEIAVKHILAGEVVINRSAVANPQALDLYIDLKELFINNNNNNTHNNNNNNNNTYINNCVK